MALVIDSKSKPSENQRRTIRERQKREREAELAETRERLLQSQGIESQDQSGNPPAYSERDAGHPTNAQREGGLMRGIF